MARLPPGGGHGHARAEWTRQQAIDFMAENTALTLLNIRNEVDRYIAWPGQALAYKIGELRIRELRALAEKELGPRFNLREFHDVVLTSGAVPLDLLEQMVSRWVKRAKLNGKMQGAKLSYIIIIPTSDRAVIARLYEEVSLMAKTCCCPVR